VCSSDLLCTRTLEVITESIQANNAGIVGVMLDLMSGGIE